ncbi:DUF5690 family protein [Sphingomonas psychrotolerans]|uniref:DUF5690 family protein n=1 Tax=Sphingomonas psychrotolerans TaxID=1327635 RepID=UPI0018F49ABC|nr:DUF5690 family protein [Sphingomonas psychrotolerans]
MQARRRNPIDPVAPPKASARLLAGVAAFLTYLAMYAFRKPIAAATYADVAPWLGWLDYKTALLLAQVIGYALSKIIGIRVIAEQGRNGRATTILSLIGVSWLALLAFPLVPPGWGVACLLLNGLPLGMVWGLVFAYLEGRRTSEILAAMLSASFILSSGLMKSVGTLLLQAGIGAFWMPALTGLLFAPLLIASLWLLDRTPPPDAEDERQRGRRAPMNRAGRIALLRRNWLPLTMLITAYVALSALRDFRDNFAPELWAELGYADMASIFSLSEAPVAVIVLCGLAAGVLIRDNMRALLALHAAIFAGALLLAGGTLAFQAGWIGPLAWMILVGTGLYLGYVPFSAMLFDRLIATLGQPANAGFLIYVADAGGYGGSVGLLLYRSLAAPKIAWLRFFIDCVYGVAALVALLTLLSALHLAARPQRWTRDLGLRPSVSS